MIANRCSVGVLCVAASLVAGCFGSIKTTVSFCKGEADLAVALPELRTRLHSPDSNVRALATIAAGTWGEEARELVADLTANLGHSRKAVRLGAATALSAMGKDAKEAVPQLVSLLADADMAVRKATAVALCSMGGHAQPAVPRLISLLNDKDASVRKIAALALASIAKDKPGACRSAVPNLRRMEASDADTSVREVAGASLKVVEGRE